MTEVIKYYDKIPRHPTKKWKTRKLSTIKKVVVHQLASPAYPGTKDIDNNIKYFLGPNHVSSTGCPYIPYHAIIDENGVVYQTNHLNEITWHCKGFNTESIGIAVMGSFDGPGFIGKDHHPTDEQINSLIKILDGLVLYTFNDLTKLDIYGHCELDPTNKPACPGTDILRTLKEWRIKK